MQLANAKGLPFDLQELECLQDHLDDLAVECRDIVGNLTELESEVSICSSQKESVLSAAFAFFLSSTVSRLLSMQSLCKTKEALSDSLHLLYKEVYCVASRTPLLISLEKHSIHLALWFSSC